MEAMKQFQVIKAPIPSSKMVPGSLAHQISQLKKGEALVYTGNSPQSIFNHCSRHKMKAKTRKQPNGTLLVWRVK
jgi:hypothetical protein